MSTPEPPTATHRRYGLYYPYFNVRDERWLKVAALYWPRIVRIVPEDYATRDSETVRVLTGELGFVERAAPGRSVASVAPRLLELLAGHAPELRRRFGVRPQDVHGALQCTWLTTDPVGERRPLGALHTEQILPAVADALVEAGLAVKGRIDLSHEADLRWLVMDESLVSLYSTLLSQDFAAANQLRLTTDKPDAYALTHEWTAPAMAAALLDRPAPGTDGSDPELAEQLAVLALRLVVPADMDRVPVRRIVELRRRHGAAFLDFGRTIDETAAELCTLAEIADPHTRQQYLEDEIHARFALPLEELRRCLRDLSLDAATMAINVKTQIPAALAVAGGAWLAGQQAAAGTAAVALGLVTVRRNVRQEREAAVRAARPVSFLLHTQGALSERRLLSQTLHRIGRIAGTHP
ncbi:DUF6236 family protein [Streptomyces sp. NPDC049837]|uniref:DUF6236 family protein n=1 Tax=Streptomyces sp. NPDC049837 TaxID=3155277 RepID=UPI003446D3AB